MRQTRRYLAIFWLAIAGAGLSLAPACLSSAQEAGEADFNFIVFGDMPYRMPGDLKRLENLIALVNAEEPAFSVHVGDVKSGLANCSTDYYLTIRSYFDSFDGALIYTPGDNDWADCDRILAGGYDTRERLAELRRIFFSESSSMGGTPISLTRQAKGDGHPDMPENAIWDYGGITFATIHMVGYDNNLTDDRKEFEARNAADIAWIEETFQHAVENSRAGIVLLFHADIFSTGAPKESFAGPIAAITAAAEAFGRPVLLINGDSHIYGIDNPIRRSDTGRRNRNIKRVIVFGNARMHAVMVTVKPGTPDLFSVNPLIIENNNTD